MREARSDRQSLLVQRVAEGGLPLQRGAGVPGSEDGADPSVTQLGDLAAPPRHPRRGIHRGRVGLHGVSGAVEVDEGHAAVAQPHRHHGVDGGGGQQDAVEPVGDAVVRPPSRCRWSRSAAPADSRRPRARGGSGRSRADRTGSPDPSAATRSAGCVRWTAPGRSRSGRSRAALAASRTRRLVSSLTLGLSRSARETVGCDTPASRATSWLVTTDRPLPPRA